MSKPNSNTDTWFDVTITETYHHTYKIRARNQYEADQIANDLVIGEIINPTNDGGQTYDREVKVEYGEKPVYAEEGYSRDDLA